MQRLAFLFVLAVASGVLWLALPAEAGQSAGRGPKPELVLQYDFPPDQVVKVSDLSGKEHDGMLRDGRIVEGRRKNAVEFDGRGSITVSGTLDSLNPGSHCFTVGAFCRPMAADGVIAAMGDKADGFSLYLKGGLPQFALRSNGELSKATATEPVVLGQWVHVAGAIDPKGKLSVIINGWPVAGAPGKLMPRKPAGAFTVGADPGLTGDYTTQQHWRGLLQDIRVYWGVLERDENRNQWQDWADLPGCGCRK